MSELDSFVKQINDFANKEELTIEEARKVVTLINEFLYTTYDGIGTIEAIGRTYNYFSEFHRYWDKNHQVILDIKINDSQCEKVADVFHDIYVRTNGKAFKQIYNTDGRTDSEICRIRLLTANQDFRGSRSFVDFSHCYANDPSIFDIQNIIDDPVNFLKEIKVSDLSQNDKRIQYAKNIASFIKERVSEPFDLLSYYKNDVYALRSDLINNQGAGYGNKKSDMFIRDMVVLGVWEKVIGFEKIDVASDVNTMKIALKTGIMNTSIPLVSSFIDYFGVQYGYVYEMSAKAWRRVWEIWKNKYPSESVDSPCLMDYFVYNVLGREICKQNLVKFQCDSEDHTFFWQTSKNKTCQYCRSNGKKNIAHPIKKFFPCENEKGQLSIEQTDFFKSNICNPNINNCPLKVICEENGKRYIGTPKAISIIGQTGWESAYSKKGEGGGGIMG